MSMTAYPGNMQWLSTVQAAFPATAFGERMLKEAANGAPSLPVLFEDIAQHVLALKRTSSNDGGSNSKKRKLYDEGSSGQSQNEQKLRQTEPEQAEIAHPMVAYECTDVSFQAPARRKLKLQIVADSGDDRKKELRLIHPTTNQAENVLPADQINEVFCLPVPDKQQRQWNFVIFPKPSALSSDGMPAEQIVFAMNELKPSGAVSIAYKPMEDDTYITVTELELGRMLQPFGKRVTTPDAQQFASSIPQAHRKGEKAYHVNAHRGSKEGYLFFLSNGVVFGFKKPLAFFPFSSIESISYTSVLQRTFNLVIAAMDGGDVEVKETEFSMLDQADFAGIDEYVKRHGLNDASMAAQRRAKAYGVNKDRKAEANGDHAAAGQDDESELQKAEQQLQDEEDEEEEDYEASGGDSDGEGDYSSEEEEDEYGDEDGEEEKEEEGREDD